jgi:hypothetical protein
MHEERTNRGADASPVTPGEARSGKTFSRRQALGRMSVAAGAGAAAWVVPEILTAKPAAGATMSGNHVPTGSSTNSAPATSPSTTGSSGSGTGGTPTAAATSPSTLAFTGIDIKRDAEIGAALIAGGWAMHHWASRTPKPATEAVAEAHQAGSQVDPA